MHAVYNFWSLRYCSRSGTESFFLPHCFIHSRCVLTVDFSNLTTQLLVFPRQAEKIHIFSEKRHFKFVCLTHLNCQHHGSGTIGPLLSKVRISWTQALGCGYSFPDNPNDGWETICNVSIHSMEWLDKRRTHITGWVEWDGKRLHHTVQNGSQCKT